MHLHFCGECVMTKSEQSVSYIKDCCTAFDTPSAFKELLFNSVLTFELNMAYLSLVTENFYGTPCLGTLPVVLNQTKEYHLEQYIPEADRDKVSEVLVYVFFTGLPHATAKPITRAVYELYTEKTSQRYSQLMNAVFNQKDTVINSANLWFPYTTGGTLKARIPAKWVSGVIPDDAYAAEKKTFKNLDEAMTAYATADDKQSYFMHLFLLGYRLNA